MSRQLEARLRTHLQRHAHKNELLFVNGRGRPFSANELREKQLHALLDVLGIPRGGFHSMRHGAASSLLAAGASPVMQAELRKRSPTLPATSACKGCASRHFLFSVLFDDQADACAHGLVCE
jgi:integrase